MRIRRGLACLGVCVCRRADGGATERAQTSRRPSRRRRTGQNSKDALGRTTPRGTVLGFLAAARKGDNASRARSI